MTYILILTFFNIIHRRQTTFVSDEFVFGLSHDSHVIIDGLLTFG